MTLPATLTEDEIDDILWLSRIDDLTELKTVIDGIVTEKKLTKYQIVTAAVGSDGNSALHYSSANGHARILTYLIEVIKPDSNGASSAESQGGSSSTTGSTSFLNTKNEAGNTPLHWAAINGHVSTLKLLLDAGADAGILNAAGHDAMFEAEINGREAAVELLLREGEGLMASAFEQTRPQNGDSTTDAEHAHSSLNGGQAGSGDSNTSAKHEDDEEDLDDGVTMVEEGMENVQIVRDSNY